MLTVVPVVPAGPVALRQRLRAPSADYIVVEMARHLLGKNWMAEYVAARQQRRHRARAAVDLFPP